MAVAASERQQPALEALYLAVVPQEDVCSEVSRLCRYKLYTNSSKVDRKTSSVAVAIASRVIVNFRNNHSSSIKHHLALHQPLKTQETDVTPLNVQVLPTRFYKPLRACSVEMVSKSLSNFFNVKRVD